MKKRKIKLIIELEAELSEDQDNYTIKFNPSQIYNQKEVEIKVIT